MSKRVFSAEDDETTRVFVSNLAGGKNKTTESDLRAFFGQVGQVTDISIPRGRGMAFVGFRTNEEAKRAVTKLNRAYCGNQRLCIRPALPLRHSTKKSDISTVVQEPPLKKPTSKGPTKRDEFFELMTGKPRYQKETVADEEEMNNAANNEQLDDLAYLRTKAVPSVDKKQKIQDEKDEDEKTGRLLVRNIACEEEELFQVFGVYGTVSEVHAPIDKKSKQQLGYAFVRFVLPEAAEKARLALDGKALHGKPLRVVQALEQTQDDETPIENQSWLPRTFSEKRQAERRAAAAKAPHKTGMLNEYVREDAAFTTAAKRAGVDKKQALVNTYDSGNAAVTMALAEASLQTETREFFLERGYDISNEQAPRSRQALLVKNLPSDTNEAELRTLFGSDLKHLYLAPANTTAIAIFAHPTEARAALKRHAYRRFRRLPLYLDWAPQSQVEIGQKRRNEQDEAMVEEAINEEPTPTLYVKNLAFCSTTAGLEEIFAHCQGFRAVSMPPPKTEDKRNRGFGFVSFATADDAAAALRRNRGKMLDDRVLDLQFAASQTTSATDDEETTNVSKIPSASELKRRGKNPTKLVVRNLAFAATVQDVRSLFSALGQISTVRLPKRFDGRHRGFAFVDFASYRDAAAALSALKSAHLFGRHLVLDFADAATPTGQEDLDDDNDDIE